jgi:hypothetical protein
MGFGEIGWIVPFFAKIVLINGFGNQYICSVNWRRIRTVLTSSLKRIVIETKSHIISLYFSL